MAVKIDTFQMKNMILLMFKNKSKTIMYIYTPVKSSFTILNAKNFAPLSISIFSGSKLITSNFSVIQMMCPCRKIIFVTNSNA